MYLTEPQRDVPRALQRLCAELRTPARHEDLTQQNVPTVLIVDDAPETVLWMREVLRDLPCEIHTAGSGEEALLLLQCNDYAVALLDVQLPNIDGTQLAQRMKQNVSTEHVPIIFVTGSHKGDSHVHKGYLCGAVDYMFKPLHPLVLRSKVKVFLELDRHRDALELIQQLKTVQRALSYSASHDSLTGLANRDSLYDAIDRAICGDEPFGVLYIDLDDFKSINDSLGHAVGDELLREAALRIKGSAGTMDTVARIGGDEFAIVINQLNDMSEGARVATLVQEAIASRFVVGGREVYTTASVGISTNSVQRTNVEDVLRDADLAMYRAKESGPGHYREFDTSMYEALVAAMELEMDLRKAVVEDQFEVYYQPLVKMNAGELVGFESLIRWCHPLRGFVAPAEFIPLAERTGLISSIGRWVLVEACQQMSLWQDQFPQADSLTVSVNVSPIEFAEPNFVTNVAEILHETNLDSRYLQLEITESVLMADARASAGMLDELRSLGVRIALDDFGTGYSSLSYLHRFPIDTLKIDRSFVQQLTARPGKSTVFVRAIVDLARSLNMRVVAEGVETAEQWRILESLNCDMGQGYLFWKPMDNESARALLAKHAAGRSVALFPG